MVCVTSSSCSPANTRTGPANGGVAPLADLGQGDDSDNPIAGACSIIATAIVVERSWTLRRSRIIPDGLVHRIWQLYRQGQLSDERIEEIRIEKLVAGELVGQATKEAVEAMHAALMVAVTVPVITSTTT